MWRLPGSAFVLNQEASFDFHVGSSMVETTEQVSGVSLVLGTWLNALEEKTSWNESCQVLTAGEKVCPKWSGEKFGNFGGQKLAI